MVPSLVIGGVLAEIDGERLLEIPLICLGVAWAAVGRATLAIRRPA